MCVSVTKTTRDVQRIRSQQTPPLIYSRQTQEHDAEHQINPGIGFHNQPTNKLVRTRGLALEEVFFYAVGFILVFYFT